MIEQGTDVTVISWGASVIQCLNALDETELSVELIDLRTMYPFDLETICQSVSKTGRAVIVHEAPLTCGLGAELSARIQEECFGYLEAPVQRVAGFDTVMPYYKLELDYLPNARRVKEAVETVAQY